MANETQLPKFDPLQGRQGVHDSTRDYINLIEKQNQQRVIQLLQQRRRSRITGLTLAGIVVGIYTYTLFAVKQEKFLDDFEEPKFIEKKA